jgi:uncharacterized membrane protein
MENRGSSDSPASEGLGKQRLEALMDGIFAIAMTLLVLDVKLPATPKSADITELTRVLLELWPRFLVFFASFVILGVLWIGQIGYFHFVKRTNRWFLWLSLLFLMFIVFIPFSTDLLGRYPMNAAAIVIYGCNALLLEITLFLQWHYATHARRLVGAELETELVARGNKRMLAGICMYSTAIIFAFLIPPASLTLFVLIPVMYILPSRVDYHWTHSHG